jgi:2,3-bisphosphoglycerate-independent phosphoglycerate mutase
MVGHTGDFAAAMKAAETVDACLKQLMDTLEKHKFSAIVIADHGNSDYMINENGTPNTAHTTNLVPCFLLGKQTEKIELKNGKLADIAPTILQLMNIIQPEEMTGISLIK